MTLIKMIDKATPSDFYTYHKVGLYLLNSRKNNINEQNISGHFKLLFDISKVLLNQEGLQPEDRKKI